MNKNSYDIVHTHTPIASSIVRLVCRKEVQTKVFIPPMVSIFIKELR
ncbi:hypothetical protein LOS24_10540 [Enterococcus faecium]|nr:hypothetical protein [Enterococcus faecium]